MRVTDTYAQRHYLGNNNRSMENMLNIENKVLTQKAFKRASEDSISANKAMKIRQNLANLDMYDENLNTAKDLFKAGETILYDMADTSYIKASTLLVSVQDTYVQDELDAIALQLQQIGDELVSNMNSDFGGRQMFAGTSSNKTPFTIEYQLLNEDGTVKTGDDGKPVTSDLENITVNNLPYKTSVSFNGQDINSHQKPSEFPGGGGIYVDIGLGIEYDDNGDVVPSTAMDMSMNGAKLTGCGVDSDGDSNSMLQLVYDAAAAVRNGDRESANRLIDKLANAQNKVLESIVTIGTNQNKIDFYLDKNESYRFNLKEKQNEVEGCNLTEEISNFSSAKAAYDAVLQIGASSIPKSIFEFI